MTENNNKETIEESKEVEMQKDSVEIAKKQLKLSIIFNMIMIFLMIITIFIMIFQKIAISDYRYKTDTLKNTIINYQYKTDTLTEQKKNLQEENYELNKLKPNEVEHNGTLKIRILKNSKPISFIAYFVSCAKGKQLQKFKAVLEKEVEIDDYQETLINCQLDQNRWLLDRFVSPMIMPNYDIEINGKIIPNKYVINDNHGKSANYIVLLKRKK